MNHQLHLVHLRPRLDRLLPWAQRQGLVAEKGRGDLGYALHAALRAAFSEAAPQPFSYRSNHGLLAYTTQAEALRSAVPLASPDIAQMLGLDPTPESPGLLIRAFPESWKEGQVLAFEVRLRPVTRKDDKENDVFLSAAQRSPDDSLSRQAVYIDWLKRQFGTSADLHEVSMREFSISSVIRRSASSHGTRPARPVQGPDVVCAGKLQVVDPKAFAVLVARGIGRHRAFGFGMLLLKTATAD